MDIQQLKYFKAVAEAGKISDAADSLFISAPALSMAISRLEKEIGARLFDRTNNRIILNRQGEIFLRYVKRTLTELEYTKTELRQSLAENRHHISLACVSATQWVELITSFAQEHPDFAVSCVPVRQIDLGEGMLFTNGNLLLAARNDVGTALDTELDSIPLFQEYPYIMVHKDHPLAQKTSVDVAELKGENLFLPMPGDSLYHYLVEIFETAELPFPMENCYSYLTAQRMAANGVGIGFTTSRYVRDASLDVRYIPIRNLPHSWVFCLFWRKNRVLTDDEVVAKEFIENYYKQRNAALSFA